MALDVGNESAGPENKYVPSTCYVEKDCPAPHRPAANITVNCGNSKPFVYSQTRMPPLLPLLNTQYSN